MLRVLPVAIVCSLLASSTARADAPRRVVLVAMSPRVLPAATTALKPWSIEVEAVTDPAPTNNVEAAAIAKAHDATAVAWIDHGELVIYDDRRGVSERHATDDSDSDEAAASIALSIKTSMRNVAVAAVEPAAPLLIEVLGPNPPPPPPTIYIHDGAAERHHGFVPRVSANVGAGVPLGAGDSSTTMRFAARASLEIPHLGELAPTAGLEAGPAAPVQTTEMSGSYRDIAISTGLELHQRLSRRLWIVPALLGTIHLTHLDGTVASMGMGNPQPVSASSTPFGVQLEVSLEGGGRVRGGATVYGSFLAGADHYTVKGKDVVGVPAATLGLALRVSFQ